MVWSGAVATRLKDHLYIRNIDAIAFTHDDRYVLVAQRWGVAFYDAETGKPVAWSCVGGGPSLSAVEIGLVNGQSAFRLVWPGAETAWELIPELPPNPDAATAVGTPAT